MLNSPEKKTAKRGKACGSDPKGLERNDERVGTSRALRPIGRERRIEHVTTPRHVRDDGQHHAVGGFARPGRQERRDEGQMRTAVHRGKSALTAGRGRMFVTAGGCLRRSRARFAAEHEVAQHG